MCVCVCVSQVLTAQTWKTETWTCRIPLERSTLYPAATHKTGETNQSVCESTSWKWMIVTTFNFIFSDRLRLYWKRPVRKQDCKSSFSMQKIRLVVWGHNKISFPPLIFTAQQLKRSWENKIICPKATGTFNQEASSDGQTEQTDDS